MVLWLRDRLLFLFVFVFEDKVSLYFGPFLTLACVVQAGLKLAEICLLNSGFKGVRHHRPVRWTILPTPKYTSQY